MWLVNVDQKYFSLFLVRVLGLLLKFFNFTEKFKS